MANVSDAYLRNAVLTATPEQLHLMLYDGAIRFSRQGIEGLAQKNWEAAFNGLSRAQKIVIEMLNSLNYEARVSARDVGAADREAAQRARSGHGRG
jgi:flagellar protein FliS